MPLSMPPADGCPAPQTRTLSVGTTLWRLHSDQYAPDQFNPTVPARFAGGRFDSTDGTYAYLYAGSDSIAAVAETLLRDRPASGPYLIPRKMIAGRELSKLTVAAELTVAVLHGAGLTFIRQKAELGACGAGEYDTTRAWAVSLRAAAPTIAGFEWRPRHDNDRFAYVFFGDRCVPSEFVVHDRYSLDNGRGRWMLTRALDLHGVALS